MRIGALFALALVLGLAACESVIGPLLGAGASAALTAERSRKAVRTFTHEVQPTKSAALAALKRMGFEAHEGHPIEATGSGRSVEVALEPITAAATRVVVQVEAEDRADRATAEEVLRQTAALLEEREGAYRNAKGMVKRAVR